MLYFLSVYMKCWFCLIKMNNELWSTKNHARYPQLDSASICWINKLSFQLDTDTNTYQQQQQQYHSLSWSHNLNISVLPPSSLLQIRVKNEMLTLHCGGDQ